MKAEIPEIVTMPGSCNTDGSTARYHSLLLPLGSYQGIHIVTAAEALRRFAAA